MKSNFKKDRIPFTQVANDVLSSTKLSLKAKGLYGYLFSKPDGWDFSSDRIKKENTDGRRSILEGLKELEDFGVLQRNKQGDGRMEYVLKYSTQSAETALRVDDPKCDNSTVLKPHSAKTAPISNIDIDNNKEKNSNKYTEQSSGIEIGEVIKQFESINPACKNFYGNKNQRKACDELILTYSYQRVLDIISQTLPKTNKILFMPNITTPIQLRDKMTTLEDAIIKYKARIKPTKGRAVIA